MIARLIGIHILNVNLVQAEGKTGGIKGEQTHDNAQEQQHKQQIAGKGNINALDQCDSVMKLNCSKPLLYIVA